MLHIYIHELTAIFTRERKFIHRTRYADQMAVSKHKRNTEYMELFVCKQRTEKLAPLDLKYVLLKKTKSIFL